MFFHFYERKIRSKQNLNGRPPWLVLLAFIDILGLSTFAWFTSTHAVTSHQYLYQQIKILGYIFLMQFCKIIGLTSYSALIRKFLFIIISMGMKCLFLLIPILSFAMTQHQQAIVQPAQSQTYLIFSPTCYNVIFKQFNFQNAQCLKMVSSRLMGVVIILGALVSRVPQIAKIIQNKSVQSLSINSIILQQVAQTSSMAYNIYRHNPFNLYGQSIALNLQFIIIHVLFIVFGPQQRTKSIISFPAVIIFFLVGYFYELGFFPDYLIQNAIVLQIILILASNLSQIYEIHKMKSTGSLAFIPYGSTVLGSSVRIYTILVETEGDCLLLSSFAIALLTNLYICLCFVIFKQPDQQSSKTKNA